MVLLLAAVVAVRHQVDESTVRMNLAVLISNGQQSVDIDRL